MNELKAIIPEVLMIFFSSLITWFFTKRKQTAEAEGAELDNVEQATAIWRELANEFKVDISRLNTQQEQLLKSNLELRKEVLKLENHVQKLTLENKHLQTLIQNQS